MSLTRVVGSSEWQWNRPRGGGERPSGMPVVSWRQNILADEGHTALAEDIE